MPASSLYCCHMSVSRISAAARKRRIAASPFVRPPLAPATAVSANPAPTAPAPIAAPFSKNDRRLVDSVVGSMTPPPCQWIQTRPDTGRPAPLVSPIVRSITLPRERVGWERAGGLLAVPPCPQDRTPAWPWAPCERANGEKWSPARQCGGLTGHTPTVTLGRSRH